MSMMWFKREWLLSALVLIATQVPVSPSEIIAGHFQRGWEGQDVQKFGGLSLEMTMENVTITTCSMLCICEDGLEH
jgi:hypothetical protein